jgi:hypothetical protein
MLEWLLRPGWLLMLLQWLLQQGVMISLVVPDCLGGVWVTVGLVAYG